MLKVFACLFLLVAAVSTYDFSDSDFNEYLFEELKADFDDVFENSFRSRRDAAEVADATAEKKGCSRRDFKKDFHCCNNDKIDAQHFESFKETKKECFKQIRGNSSEDSFDPFDCQKMQHVKEQMVCICECMAKKFSMIDDSGEFRREGIIEQIRKTVSESQWNEAAVNGVVDKCMLEVMQKKAEAAEIHDKGCNPCPLNMQHCLWREILIGCPADLRVDSPKCNRLRDRLSKGDHSVVNKNFLSYFNRMRELE